MRLEPDYIEEQLELFGEVEMKSIEVICDRVILSPYNLDRVEAELVNVNVASIIGEFSDEEVLDCLDKDVIKRYIAEHGDD